MTVQELLEYAKSNSGRVQTAAAFLKQFGNPAADDERTNKFVYTEDGDTISTHKSLTKELIEEFPADAVAMFDAVITTVDKDRDGDILQSKGASLVDKMPLLFGHDWDRPIGVMIKSLEHSSKKIKARFAIVDSELGRDCAKLVRMGALRISHGFLPAEFEPIKDKSGKITGFDISKFEIYETSLVTVPSNVNAVVETNYEKNFETDAVKSWLKAMAGKQTKEVPETDKSLHYCTPDFMPGSYEETQQLVMKACYEKFHKDLDCDFWCYPVATFAGKSIIGCNRYMDGSREERVYEVQWTQKEGKVSVSDYSEVQVSIVAKALELATKIKEASAEDAPVEPEEVVHDPIPAEEAPVEPVAEESAAEPETELVVEVQPIEEPVVTATATPDPVSQEDPILALFT